METDKSFLEVKKMSELEYKINELSEVYSCKLKRLIHQYWDLIDMMVYDGYKVDWERTLLL